MLQVQLYKVQVQGTRSRLRTHVRLLRCISLSSFYNNGYKFIYLQRYPCWELTPFVSGVFDVFVCLTLQKVNLQSILIDLYYTFALWRFSALWLPFNDLDFFLLHTELFVEEIRLNWRMMPLSVYWYSPYSCCNIWL